MEFPHHFLCPISLELMEDPVIISTGVTYERRSIEKWFFTYRKKVCPATMQSLDSFQITPNHTLKRLIVTWVSHQSDFQKNLCDSRSSEEMSGILGSIESSPFKVSALRKLRLILEKGDDDLKTEFKKLGGVEVVIKILLQLKFDSSENSDFAACEEAAGVLNLVSVSDKEQKILGILMGSEFMNSMSIILRHGGAEAKFSVISTFLRIASTDYCWNYVAEKQGIDFFKSLFEIVSDEISTKSSSRALQLLLEITSASRKSRLKAIDAGGVFTLVELLPDSGRSKCERILRLLKLICETSEGRTAFTDHALGIAAVSKKIMNVSPAATSAAVKILWLISNFQPRERVVEEYLFCGAVKRLVALLKVGGGVHHSMVKDRATGILMTHGRVWRRYPCFPADVSNFLGRGSST